MHSFRQITTMSSSKIVFFGLCRRCDSAEKSVSGLLGYVPRLHNLYIIILLVPVPTARARVGVWGTVKEETNNTLYGTLWEN